MYTNVAYLNNSVTVVKDLSKPLLVTSCGYYRVDSGPVIKTNRPKGRRDYQLLYVAEGKTHFYFQGAERIVQKGEMVLFRPYEAQSYFYYPKEKCEIFWVHFTGNEVESLLSRYHLPNGKNVFFASVSPDYPWIFEQMIRELQLCRANYQELLTILLRHIFLLVDRYLQEGSKTDVIALNAIERAIRYFHENYMQEIQIDEYAKSLHVSPCWFTRRFKQVTKTTPLQYILSVRITNAKTLLTNKSYNVAETARAVGFRDPLYFSRIFTKHVGVSPTEYKKLHTEK